jgi:predicted RNA-binding Zn-ribbon protein involved in translation (DUF1610 family)
MATIKWLEEHRTHCKDCGKSVDYRSSRCYSCNKKGNRHHNFKYGETLKEHHCLDCGKLLVDYLSKRCASCAQTGELSPNFIDGNSGIYPNIFFSVRVQIRSRDNYKCQNCGLPEEEHLIVTGKVLSVHHIDYDKNNCNENNLITLCQECNRRANFNRDYWKDFYQKKIGVIHVSY